jgi:hypothetical protein
MALFDDVFNKLGIYYTFFFNIKAVLAHPTLSELQLNNSALYMRWKYLSKTKYGADFDIKYLAGSAIDETQKHLQCAYEENAVYYPEYCKIIAITYATLDIEKGNLKREFKKILSEDEKLVIDRFMDELYTLSSAAVQSTPQFFPPLCGHNIISYDIPLLIKRFIDLNVQKNETPRKELPLILKRSLGIKPWESGIIDTSVVWKFNGLENISLMLIADYLKLKKTVDLLPVAELSKYYWQNINQKPKETLEFVALQSATQTNLVIQLMNELRQL